MATAVPYHAAKHTTFTAHATAAGSRTRKNPARSSVQSRLVDAPTGSPGLYSNGRPCANSSAIRRWMTASPPQAGTHGCIVTRASAQTPPTTTHAGGDGVRDSALLSIGPCSRKERRSASWAPSFITLVHRRTMTTAVANLPGGDAGKPLVGARGKTSEFGGVGRIGRASEW